LAKSFFEEGDLFFGLFFGLFLLELFLGEDLFDLFFFSFVGITCLFSVKISFSFAKSLLI